mgnify:FL=1
MNYEMRVDNSVDEVGESDFKNSFSRYSEDESCAPLFLQGDALQVLRKMPSCSIDMAITSFSNYMMKREYFSDGCIEPSVNDLMDDILAICAEIYRVLKPTGSFWFHLGDDCVNGNLALIPARVAIRLTDEVGFTLHNQIAWNKLTAALGLAKGKLCSLWEPIFFFSKEPKGYFYDANAAFELPRKARNIMQGVAVSAAGMSSERYRRKIERSTELTELEKTNAYDALNKMLHLVECGKVSDFRMVLRGETRTAHGSSAGLSSCEKELAENGFHFITFKRNGALISDVWNVLPEDENSGELIPDVWNVIPEDAHRAEYHYEPFPEDLVKNPIALTCPEGGIVLDPFAGTGATCKVAQELGRKSIGIESSATYLTIARERCNGNASC